MHSDTRRSLWHPEDASQLLTVNTQQLCVWDVESRTLINTLNVNPGEKSFHISGTRWSPHSNCAIVGFGSARNLYANDLRCSNEGSNSFAWTIANAHADTVRDLDFNPNAQYHLVSCGDDCEYKFWDVRNCKVPAVVMRSQHSHWVWSVRYNQYHDQLVLSCSSDSRVVLSRIASFASQPFGHLMDDQDFSSQDENDDNEEEEEDDDEDDKPDEETIDSNRSGEEQSENNGIDTFVRKMIDHSTSKAAQLNAKVMKKKSDEVVSIYDEHEDSVYSAEWSNADPWVFASLSYDGRFVLNRVPKEEKYNLLI